MEWILWFQHTYHENVVMRHARSADGEKHTQYDMKAGKQPFYAVDGYFVDSKGVEHVLEFSGCWYHGCPRCYPRDRDTRDQYQISQVEMLGNIEKRKNFNIHGLCCPFYVVM